MSKVRLGVNYWKLWIASVVSNLGDGIAVIAYPWLASSITRDGFKLGLVVLAGRLPWLLFSLPAGVITDRVDRKRLIVGMDATRAVVTVGVAVMVTLNSGRLESPSAIAGPIADLLLAGVVLAAFLLGVAEVLRDNTAQTILPAVVDKASLEKANGRLWGAEMVMNSFVGPPLSGLLIGVALALPFFVHTGTFVVAAALVLWISGEFRPRATEPGTRPRFRAQLKEGVRWLWAHPLFRPMAVTLGVMNGAMSLALATYVLFVQEILELGPSGFGILMTGGAVGGLAGSLLASRVARALGRAPALHLTLVGGFISLVVTGLTSSAVVVWLMFLVYTALAMLWNVITVSLRQRVIPDDLLGRVNSVYRFFGWGMMSIGALIGGALVSGFGAVAGREWSLRLPFLVAAGLQLAIWAWAGPKLNARAIADTESAAETSPA
jgi:MFS family permease